jgi:hypothetical protein
MINFIQSNQNLDNEFFNIIDNEVWDNLYTKILQKEKIENIQKFINFVSINYNIDKKNIIKDFLNYIIKTYTKNINSKFLDFVENLIHSQNNNDNIYINYLISNMVSSLSI